MNVDDDNWPGFGGKPKPGQVVHYNSSSGLPKQAVCEKVINHVAHCVMLTAKGVPMKQRVYVHAKRQTRITESAEDLTEAQRAVREYNRTQRKLVGTPKSFVASKALEPEAGLMNLLDRVYRFPHNVNLYNLLRQVYGQEAHTSYLHEKAELIDRKGFTFWYCELDLENQSKVARIMLDKYKELEGMLKL